MSSTSTNTNINTNTYNKIANASQTLRKASKITGRRKAAEELIALLTSSTIRNKLKREAAIIAQTNNNSNTNHNTNNSNNNTNNDQFYTVNSILKKIYRTVLNDAYHATQKTLESNVKLKLEDLILPLKILRLIDSDSNTYLSMSNNNNNNNINNNRVNKTTYIPEPWVFEDSFDRYRYTKDMDTVLSYKEVNALIQYSLHCLDHEELCAIAENESLNLLQKLCSRGDYVSLFGNSNEFILTIIRELQLRIIPPKPNAESTSKSKSKSKANHHHHHHHHHHHRQRKSMVDVTASKTFYNLIHHLVATLGVEIQIFVQPCLYLVVDWVRNVERERERGQLQFMYGVVVDLMTAYPELCVGVLLDSGNGNGNGGSDSEMEEDDENGNVNVNLGRDLFMHAKKSWNLARGIDRDVLVGYFSAHLLVCETAAHLQGMFPGDLGDVGAASINKDKIDQLLQMFLSDGSLDLFSDLSLSTSDNGMKKRQPSSSLSLRGKNPMDRRRQNSLLNNNKNNNNNRHRRRSEVGAAVSKINPLSKRERRYLELCARILRCAQRYFLMEAERCRSENITKTLIDDYVDKSNTDEEGFSSQLEDGLRSDKCVASVEKLSNCPWVLYIMKGLCSHTNFSYMGQRQIKSLGDIPKMATASKQTQDTSYNNKLLSKNQPSNLLDVDNLEMRSGIQNTLRNSPQKTPSHTQVRIYLQIICACAEIFPRGECWSSTNQWYRSNFSPLDNLSADMLKEGGEISYCSACSCSDMASLIHSVTDILCHYGTTSGNHSVQMWGLVCLMKLTECSKIAMRYWNKPPNHFDAIDVVPLAWQRVWKTIFRHDLRYLSYTSTALGASQGELVLMLLTEIMKGSLTSLKGEITSTNHTDSFLQKQQDKLWNLPVFKSPSAVQISAPFEIISMLLNRVGLSEGDSDAFVNGEFDDQMSERMQKENLEGTGRRYRIICFCLNFIRLAVMRDEVDLLRRVLPFVTASFAALTGSNKMFSPVTTFSLQSLRIFRASESRLCLNENDYIEANASKFSIMWKDTIEPFSFQYSAENNPFLWDSLNGRDLRLCPPWSLEDRHWLKGCFTSDSESSDHVSLMKAIDLQTFGLNVIMCAAGYGSSTDEENNKKKSNISLLSRIGVAKFVLGVSLLSNYEMDKSGIHWQFVEEMFDSILALFVADIKTLAAGNEYISTALSDMIGIFRLIKESHKREDSPHQARGLLSSKHLLDLYKECKTNVKNYAQVRNDIDQVNNDNSPEKSRLVANDFNEDFEVESEEDRNDDDILSDRVSSFSQSESESDDLEEDGNHTKSGRKRKRNGNGKNGIDDKVVKKSRPREIQIRSNLSADSTNKKVMDSKGSWLCAYILVLLNPSSDVCNCIVDSIIWPQGGSVYNTFEPHDIILCLGLFNSFIPLSLTVCNDNQDEMTVLSLCTDIVGEGRNIAGPSSPYHMLGFRSCEMLLENQLRNSQSLEVLEIEDIIKVLIPESLDGQEGKKALRSIKTRPTLRLLRVQAAMKFFAIDNTDVHIQFNSKFEKLFVIESLGDVSYQVRRRGANAVGLALKHFPTDAQNDILNDVLDALSPLECIPNLTGSNQPSFDEWVDARVSKVSKNMIELERQMWERSFIVLEANVLQCISVIIGNTTSEEITYQMIADILKAPPRKFEIQAICLKCLESVAYCRQFLSLEDQINRDEFRYMKDWISIKENLLDLPLNLCCPSVLRCINRIGYQDDIDFSSLHENATDEYIFHKGSIIVPCVLIESLDADKNSNNGQDICDKRDKYLEEVAKVCVDGNVGKLLRSHIHDIYAFTLPLMNYDMNGHYPMRENAEKLLEFVLSFPKVSQRQAARSAHIIVTQILHLYGKGIYFEEDAEAANKSCIYAVKYFAEEVLNNKFTMKNGLFQSAGTSTTECLLHARRLLNNLSYSLERNQVWKMIDFIMDEVQSHACADGSQNSQLGFCLSSLLSMSIDHRNKDLRCKILAKTKTVLEAVIKDDKVAKQNHDEISWILNKLVATMIQIHEECQHSIMDFCLESWQQERSKNLVNFKFQEIANSDFEEKMTNDVDINVSMSVTGCLKIAVEKYGGGLKMELKECINLTFQILDLLLDKKKSILQKDLLCLDPFPEPNISTRDLEILMKCNPNYSLSNLTHSFENTLQQISGQTILTDAKRFDSIAKRYISNNSRSKQQISANKSLQSNDLESRTLLSGIDRVRKRLTEKISQMENYQDDSQVLIVISTTIQHLCNFCDHQYPQDIQVAAGSCLGALAPALLSANIQIDQMYNMNLEKRTYFQSDPLQHFFTEALELLASYVQSNDTETAIIAKDTLKSLLSTNDGLSTWKEMESTPELKRIVLPFLNTEKNKYDVGDVPISFKMRLMEHAGLAETDLEKDNSWCWSDGLWTCNTDGDVPFEDWIKDVVCAMLLCCYQRDKSEQNSVLSMIQGSSDFLRPCVKLCAREHKFAVSLFPAIIFDILSTDSKDVGGASQARRSHLVGAPSSLSNQTITQCFNNILKPREFNDDCGELSQDSYMSKPSPSSSDLDAVKTIVGVLDILRCVTEHKFYESNHQINTTRISGRSYDLKRGLIKIDNQKERYNDIPLTPAFNGRPYGVVLDLYDTEVADSYIQLKDYTTALYYAENYADNRLGGSGCAFEMISDRRIRQSSLSGFGEELNNMNLGDDIEHAVSFHDILKICYTALQEEDNLEGLEEQTSKLRFERPECFKDERGEFSSKTANNKDIEERALMLADVKSQILDGRGVASLHNHIAVVSSLTNLGLKDTVRHYIAGLSSNNCVLKSCSKSESSYLQEKWAEESWRMLQWDETILPKHMITHSDILNPPLAFSKDVVRKALKSSNQGSTKLGYHEALGDLFSSLIRDDISSFSSSLYETRVCLMEDLNRCVGTKVSSIGLSSHALKLMTLNEIEDLSSVISGTTPVTSYLTKWCSKSNMFLEGCFSNYSFNDIEMAMACREINLKLIYRTVGEHPDDEIGKAFVSHLQNLCSFARQHARPNLASATLERMRRFLELRLSVDESDLTKKITSMKINLETARIMQCNGDTTAAVRTCKLIISSIDKLSNGDTEELAYLRGETLLQCGTWLIKHKIDAAAIVLNRFLKRAAEQARDIYKKEQSDKSTKLLASTHFVLAEFVANLYDSVETRVSSQEWKSLGFAADGRRKELEEVATMIKDCKKSPHKLNLKIEHSKLKKEVEMDTRERRAVEDSVSQYLRLAIRAYGVALAHCTGISNHSKHVFRLVSLWFRNCNGTGKGGDINALVADQVMSKIPSFHFVPLIYQIFSRIDASSYSEDKDDYSNTEEYNEEFQNVLKRLIARICIEHPYHGLVQLIALSNGHNVAGRQASAYLNNVGDSKVEASSNLLLSMKQDDPEKLCPLIESYTILINAYISLATAPTKQYVDRRITKNIAIRDLIKGNRSQSQGQPLDSCLRRSSSLKPCVLTKIPVIRPRADYGDGLTDPVGSELISSFESNCSLTETGIHRPKIVVCIGSSGGKFKQLVKGEDDIRQDAIMQQVFQTVNVLFRFQNAPNNEFPLKNNIKLHTYNCIPLSPSTGVLEWVDNTTSFGDYLYRSSDGKKVGAHEKYHPGEWDISLCRSHYICSPRDEKRHSYDQICKNFTPCFRFFFLERFSHSPQRWHDARMSYIRSVAVNSIVGHILGIGDRHSHNILIHERTGEVVHIDFGIVFEQGKLLSTPETVPFRLTRDVVDGFGPIGTDGAFTKAAQATAEVLRENADTLITVLSAVVSDPLYSWSVSPVKARQREDDTTIFSSKENNSDHSGNISMPALAMIAENENDAATRTIAKINEKLQGYEEGTFGERQTVEGQVRLLINAARDPDNLCALYHGWMPWL